MRNVMAVDKGKIIGMLGAASGVSYDNTDSGLSSTNVQDAINEVCDDLSDKVDKVAGKGLSTNDFTDSYKEKVDASQKEFIGTMAQWNALTTAEKKAFDTYQITDDYSEALMPNYSTTEQKTGQKWIDGKDVYFKTLHIVEESETNRKSYTTEVTSLSIEKIIKLDAMVKLGTAGSSSWYTSPFYYDTAKQMIVSATNNLLNIYSDGWNFTEAYVTLYYTKTA